MTNLAAQTPVEIDTEINRLNHEIASLHAQAVQQTKLSGAYAKRGEDHAAAVAAATASDLTTKAFVLEQQASTLEGEYWRRGRWTRYYLVTNSNGHVHWTQDCSTCFIDTQFAWLTQFSGTSHEDLVELAGEKACTVCFPDAPVETRNRPSKLTTPEREAREAKKAAAKAAKEAASFQVLVFDGSARKQRNRVFKSERAVTNYIAELLNSLTWYGDTHPSAEQWLSDLQSCRLALEERGVEYNYDKALANARKKAVKDGGVAKY
jgi:hypothetical protein